eukprot:TRINITY_DN22015_c0_g1_i1.p1 TRINITY_DN22015_c0_g1~~TRINITY_DN22015_c0_g1_i1.p1  ORF type:complete len:423 (+),score=113.83 TRINITY_DN22015_c0_g1_i1:42-1310(+)
MGRGARAAACALLLVAAAGDAVAADPPPTETRRAGRANGIPLQISEVMVRQGDGEFRSFPALGVAARAWAVGGSSPPGEGAAEAVDGSLDTKYLEHTVAYFQIELDPPLLWCGGVGGADAACSYAFSFATANDAPERDPVEYNVSISADGDVWATRTVSRDLHAPADPPVETRSTPYLRAVDGGAVRTPPRGQTVDEPAAAFHSTDDDLSVSHIKYVRIETPAVRGDVGPDFAADDIPEGTSVIEGIACEDGTVMIQGHPQQACEMQEDVCRKVCTRVPTCMLYTFEDASGCCALKQFCNDRRRMHGRRAVIIRHDVHYPEHARASPEYVFKEYLQAHPDAKATTILDNLAGAWAGEDATDEQIEEFAALVEAWLADNEAAGAEGQDTVKAPLPFFATPQRLPPRAQEALVKDLDAPQRRHR